MADIELVDLEVIARYSLAIRQASAPAEEVLTALEESTAFVLALIEGASVEEADARALAALVAPAVAAEERNGTGAGTWPPGDDLPDDAEAEEAEDEDAAVAEVFAPPPDLARPGRRKAAQGTPVVRADSQPTVSIEAPRASEAAALAPAPTPTAPARRGLLRRKATPAPSAAQAAQPAPEPNPAPVRAVERDDPPPSTHEPATDGGVLDEAVPLSAEEAAARRAARRARREARARDSADT